MPDICISGPLHRDEFYRRFGKSEQPVILRAAMGSWPATRKWTFDWFRREHGACRVDLNPNAYRVNDDTGCAERIGPSSSMALAEYIQRVLSSGQRGYLAGNEIYRNVPTLRDDLAFDAHTSLGRWAVPSFFMGGPGTVSRTHVDWAQNLHALFVGRKHWKMWAPHRLREMQPIPADWRFSVSGRDLNGPATIPVAPDLDFVLEAGDLLYVPYGWWHWVETEQPAIAANLWFWTRDMLLCRGPRALATTFRIRCGIEAARWRGHMRQAAKQ
jgi:cupin-like protein